jgi:predicted cupin superfamily sugar epimerase
LHYVWVLDLCRLNKEADRLYIDTDISIIILILYIFLVLKESAEYWINKLKLHKHPEGGYFVETYKSEKCVNLQGYNLSRHACTAIYYLLIGDQFSSFHRMRSDEVWHFYAGNSLTLHIIETDGKLNEVRLGTDIDNGETFQAVVKSGSWFAASVNDHDSYSLVGCTVSPGFEYSDWDLGEMETLNEIYPQYKSIIEKYTRSFSATRDENGFNSRL